MKELLTEFLAAILSEKKVTNAAGLTLDIPDTKPPEAKFSAGGKWYSDEKHTDYVGRMYQGKWVSATAAEKEQEKTVAGLVDKGVLIREPDGPERFMSRGVQQQPDTQPTQDKEDGVSQGGNASVSAQQATREIYGVNGNGPLLLDSKTTQRILDNGFVEGEGAPPGNAGSNFNENMSDEGSLILQRYPEMDETTLVRVLFERTRRSKLGQQQNKVATKGTETYKQTGRARLSVPSDITDPQEQIIYQNCLIAARSGRQKYIRSLKGVAAAQEAIGFTKIKERRCFGGAAEELQSAQDMVQGASRCFVFDEQLGLLEVPKEILKNWIQASGGGENAADTVNMTMDVNGNLIYDGWSDKKTLADIQGNSSLRDEYAKMADQMSALLDDGRISEEDHDEAVLLLGTARDFSDSLEDQYADTSAQLAETFLQPSFMEGTLLDECISLAKSDKVVGKNRFGKFAKKIQGALAKKGGTASDKAVRTAHAEGVQLGYSEDKLTWFIINKLAEQRLLTGDERKILERVAKVQIEIQKTRNDGRLPEKFNGLRIKAALQRLRTEAIDFQRQQIEELNKITVRNEDGDKVKLGNHLKALEIVKLLHLDKIEEPTPPDENASPEEKEEYYKQVLVRSTQLIMEGIPVKPQTIKECLGVKNIREFNKNFVVEVGSVGADEEGGEPGVEGATVYIYALDTKGGRRLVARKSYRSKQGDTGKTGTTIIWERDMQKCFDAKAARK